MGGECRILAVLVLSCLTSGSKCDQTQYNINLNDFMDANLAYFQETLPPDLADGRLLFGEVNASDATYYNISMFKIENFEREGNFQQVINLDTMVNNVSGVLSSPLMTLRVGRIDSPSYFGPMSPLLNVSIELASTQFTLSLVMSPSAGSRGCTLTLAILVSVAQAILYTDVPFANDRNITQFFDETILDYFNSNLSTMTTSVYDADCNPYTAYQVLLESVKQFSRQTADEFIKPQQNFFQVKI